MKKPPPCSHGTVRRFAAAEGPKRAIYTCADCEVFWYGPAEQGDNRLPVYTVKLNERSQDSTVWRNGVMLTAVQQIEIEQTFDDVPRVTITELANIEAIE